MHIAHVVIVIFANFKHLLMFIDTTAHFIMPFL